MGAVVSSEIALGEARAAVEPGDRGSSRAAQGFGADLMARVDQLAERALGSPAPGPLWSLCAHDDRFPPGIAELYDAPPAIFGCGDGDRVARLGREPAVAVVGARRATPGGREVTYRIARDVAAGGVTVVSGMAYGIDAAAHRGSLSAHGLTVAVLAGSPNVPYPAAHMALHREIAARGLVISEFPPGSRVAKWSFPARNRLIAALARVTVVVEGRDGSGATHTTEFATQLGRQVAAVPGNVMSSLSALPNSLLYDGAHLVRDGRDLLDLVCGPGRHGGVRALATDAGVDPQLRVVLEAVRSGAATAEAVCEHLTGVDGVAARRALGRLELLGLVRRDESGRYVAAG